MKLYEFLNQPEESQYQTIWDMGGHIDNVRFDGKIYQLYAINDFFVEVLYDSIENRILRKSQFKYGEQLEKYIN